MTSDGNGTAPTATARTISYNSIGRLPMKTNKSSDGCLAPQIVDPIGWRSPQKVSYATRDPRSFVIVPALPIAN